MSPSSPRKAEIGIGLPGVLCVLGGFIHSKDLRIDPWTDEGVLGLELTYIVVRSPRLSNAARRVAKLLEMLIVTSAAGACLLVFMPPGFSHEYR